MLLAVVAAAAQGSAPSPYPRFIKGEEFFIPGKPLVVYLTVQPRFTAIEHDSRNRIINDYFSLRRIKLRMLGEPTPQLSYYSQGVYKTHNFSPTDNDISLQEGWLMWKFLPVLKLKVGQFKPPFGLERFTPDEMMFSLERSQATNRLVPNGNLDQSFTRDYGVQASGFFSRPKLGYELAVMGGNGANNGHLLQNGSFLLTGRFTWHPWELKKDGTDLEMGAAMSFRRNHNINFSLQIPESTKLGYQNFDGTDWRQNIFFSWEKERVAFGGECFWVRYHSYHPGQRSLNASGYYLQAAYFLHPRLQAVAKFEYFDPNNGANDQRWTTLGLNLYLVGNQLKLMANYIFKTEQKGEIHNDIFILQLQILFGYPHNPHLETWDFSRLSGLK
jgi:phosphate-selective porin